MFNGDKKLYRILFRDEERFSQKFLFYFYLCRFLLSSVAHAIYWSSFSAFSVGYLITVSHVNIFSTFS